MNACNVSRLFIPLPPIDKPRRVRLIYSWISSRSEQNRALIFGSLPMKKIATKSSASTRRSSSCGRKRRRSGFKRRLFRIVIVSGLLFISGVGAWIVWLDRDIRRELDGRRWMVPARIYARALELSPGASIKSDDLQYELELAGYQQYHRAGRPGSFTRDGDQFVIGVRSKPYSTLSPAVKLINVTIKNDRVRSMNSQQGRLKQIQLEPAEIGRIDPRHGEDRILLRLDDVSQLLIDTLLAVEDRNFYRHHGVSLPAILRAAWINLRAHSTVQGGSTLTQQLVKNFFLTPERTLTRKLREAIMALLVEYRYPKDQILEAYLNEIYLGQQGGRAIHGFGLASHYYFSRPAAELLPHETALLVAMVRSGSRYNPRRYPQAALKRRNLVLNIMRERGILNPADWAYARKLPLGISAHPPPSRTAFPAFVNLVRRQLRRDYDADDLQGNGLQIYTTLSPKVQHSAEQSVLQQLPKLQHISGKRSLQVAVIVVARNSGEVLAVVGGRDPRLPGFNRALDAVRPIGSLIKPIVYLAALRQSRRYHLATTLMDLPITSGSAEKKWRPMNYDKKNHGAVPLYQALARSYNLATVRLGLDLGLDRVISQLRDLGVQRPIPKYPSMLLGTTALTPIEITQVYLAIADGGGRIPLRAIRRISDSRNRVIGRYPRVFAPRNASNAAYLLQYGLQLVMREGTGRGAYRTIDPAVRLAGKTGTTDGLRDSWFVGFDGASVATVWIGQDDNRSTGLSGASGALRLWSDMMARIGPVSLHPQAGPDITHAWVTADGRNTTDPHCAGARRLPLIAADAPPYRRCGGGG